MKKINLKAVTSLLFFVLITLLLILVLWMILPKMAMISLKKTYDLTEINVVLDKYELNRDSIIMTVKSVEQYQLKRAISEISHDSLMNPYERIEAFYSYFDLSQKEKDIILNKIPVEDQLRLLDKIMKHPSVTVNMLPAIKKSIIKEIEKTHYKP